MDSSQLRARFLAYFNRHAHEIVRSSPLIPQNDPTLFFVNAGMVQFKDVFLGADPRPYKRATTVQKCLRVSGKHNDLENVGHTARHHTLFEMLGNFSFGDYFKREAIKYAWDLLTNDLGIDAGRLWVTVYEEDDEALALWRDEVGVPAARIQKLGAKDNFWAMGDTGPCGPCTEIHYDHGPKISDDLRGPAGEDPRYVEIWNLVFMQYERDASGTLHPLPRPSIDTGSGLERVAAVTQGVYSNYDTDLFTPIIEHAARLANVRYRDNHDVDTALKVIADHSRAAAFLVADGVMPSNEERGYVLRRIMRRGIRYGVKIGLKGPFLYETVQTVIDRFSDAYPELGERSTFIKDVVKTEEERFAATLDRGLGLLDREFDKKPPRISGEVAFTLADTYGFPVDLTRLIAAERGLEVDEAGFEALREEQRQRGRLAWKGSGEEAVSALWHELARKFPTQFVGYDVDSATSEVVAVVSEGAGVSSLPEGSEGAVLAVATPFYAESGGQVGDTGVIRWEGGEAEVVDTTRPSGDIHVHHVRVTRGTLRAGQPVDLHVDNGRRDRSRLNHTATHLLHAALKKVLGEHVMQKGSLVGPDRLRFDFSHHKAMTADELRRVEDLVQREILANHPVATEVCDVDAAKAGGAMALFGEKYGDQVRVVSVAGFSKELCGGTHARRSGDIGFFKLASESGIAAGVRRIEAQTGWGALAYVREIESRAAAAAGLLKSSPDKLADAVQKLVDDRARLQKDLDTARREAARAATGDLREKAVTIGDIKLVAAEFVGDAKAMRDEADRLRDSLGTAVVVLAGRDEQSVRLLVAVSKDLAGKRYDAGKLISALSSMVGGKGGGRPDLAQAGGTDPSGVPAMLASVAGLLA
ncbi:MAG: alanine--tRNA ligase [Deltaproteobacteria bacterium]|nr:alanine--tRNA ligase [Deltaproteobacteria bacterium]